MLLSLQIRNFALIENETIEFGPGLNILSGETGAGKSILVQALELLLGGRGSSDLIRQGEEEAEVTGLFSKGEEFSLRRVITRSGKNKAFLNERVVPVSVLEETGGRSMDLAGQHAHQVLLKPESHLDFLDAFASLEEILSRYQDALRSYRAVLKDRDGLSEREREAREKEEFLRFQIKELNGAKIQDGEEAALQKEREVLKHAVRLGEVCARGEEALESGEDAVSARLAWLSRELEQASRVDSDFGKVAELLETGLCHLQEAAKALRNYAQHLSFEPDRLQELEDRLDLISRLKKKYGGSFEAMREKENEIRKSLDLLDNFEGEIRKKDETLASLGKTLLSLSKELSESRKAAALKLSKQIDRELQDLGMSSAKFFVDLKPLNEGERSVKVGGKFLGEAGQDDIQFLIAPNPGEGFHPLAKIASGGELARTFLAIKKVLGGVRLAPTCVFDEVDAGIGGAVAEVVGRNLAAIARKRQVICITHLPQIACYADNHFVISKKTEKGRTRTFVERLPETQREEEIARMLAGVTISDRAMAHAREMLKNAAAR